MNDTSVARNVGLVAGPAPHDVASVLDALQPQQGMLYYHLLLARIEALGEVGRASVPELIPTIIGNERRGSKRSRDTPHSGNASLVSLVLVEGHSSMEE